MRNTHPVVVVWWRNFLLEQITIKEHSSVSKKNKNYQIKLVTRKVVLNFIFRATITGFVTGRLQQFLLSQKELYWYHKLKPYAPLRLNERNVYWCTMEKLLSLYLVSGFWVWSTFFAFFPYLSFCCCCCDCYYCFYYCLFFLIITLVISIIFLIVSSIMFISNTLFLLLSFINVINCTTEVSLIVIISYYHY